MQPPAFLSAMLRLRAFDALRQRAFRRMSYSHVCSSMGSFMDEVSRGWLIYQLTDSMLQLGLVRGIQAVPLLLLAPIAGSVADRYSRRVLLMMTQSITALIFALTALLVITGLVQPWYLYVTAVLVAAVQVFQQPSRTAMVSDLVPPENLTNAIGLFAMVFNVARSLGPALAGAIIALWGTAGAFSLQALLLVLATFWTAMLPNAVPAAPRAGQRESFARSIVEGWRFSWRSEAVRAALLCTMLASLLIAPFTALLPVFARDLLEIGAGGQGLLLAAMGGGALVSAALIAGAGHRLPRGMMMLVATMAYGIALIVFAASPWFALSLAMMAIAGLCHVHSNALVMTVIQSYSPPQLRGRTMALYSMNQVMLTLGAVLLGALAGAIGPRWAVALLGAAGFAVMAAMFVGMPRARNIR